MHELSIAVSIVEAVEEELARHGAARAQAVTVRVGALSGVVPDALEFAWGPATAATRLEGATLRIQLQEVVAFCPVCAAERTLLSVEMLRCPVCSAPLTNLLRGRELQILAIELP